MTDTESSEESASENTGDSDYRVIERPFFRRKSRSVTLVEAPPPARPEPVRRPAKVAQQLALAHHLQAAIDRGSIADRAAVARKLGLTRARVTQLLDLLMLAPDLQEAVLALEAVGGVEPMAERALRAVAHTGAWCEQRGAWMGALYGRHESHSATIVPASSPTRTKQTRWTPIADRFGPLLGSRCAFRGSASNPRPFA